MQKIFFTSDLHFGHENAIRFDHRPFKTVEEMDAELIRRWNAKVGKGDLVYVLGDMIWKTSKGIAADLIKSLNGQIILIKGNHDRFLHNSAAKNLLAGLKDYDDICVTLETGSQYRCILSHYFMPFYNGHYRNAIHLHGHSHNTDEHLYELFISAHMTNRGIKNRIFNVGCMHWNYEPVTLDEILAKELTKEEKEAEWREIKKHFNECIGQNKIRTWNDYKDYIESTDTIAAELIAEAENEAEAFIGQEL